MNDNSAGCPYEEKEIRCPKLGGQVNFEYCSQETYGKPCAKALTCWSLYFDAETFFKEKLGEETFLDFFLQPAQTKMVTLVDLIEKAREVAKKDTEVK